MATQTQRSFTPRDVARVLFRHLRGMVAFFVTVVILTLLAIAFYPRSYTSEAKLFIRLGRESVALDPTATTGQTIMLQKTQVDEVNSALQLLQSRDVLHQVVATIGAERMLNDEAAASSTGGDSRGPNWLATLGGWKTRVSDWVRDTAATLRLSDPGTREDLAIRKLDNNLQAYAPKESTVLTVNYSAASPQLAHDVVEALTSVFLDEHVRVNHSEGSLEFFTAQTEKLKQELAAAQAELRDRKNEFQVTSIDSRRVIFAKQQEDVELQMLATAREMAFVDAEIADLTRAMNGLEPELVTNRVAGFANEAKDLMREKLYELELEESKLKSRYSDEHPLLQQIQRQRKESAEILKDMPDDRTQTTAALNPNQKTLELELLQAEARKKALVARQEAGQKQLDSLKTELNELNEHEVQLVELERNVQLLDGTYRMHVEKLEQARVNDALGRERISNVKIAQPATFVSKPTSPKKAVLLALGLIVATGGAFGFAFGWEILDQTLRTTEQVESALGVPVLLSFPYRRYQILSRKKNSAANSSADTRYRSLARELMHGGGVGGPGAAKAVGVVGCETRTARSRVAADLAIQAANCMASPVLLIDGDERHRLIARRFGLNGSPGWQEVVAGSADVKSCVHQTNGGRLAVMTAGAERPTSSENGHLPGDRAPLDAMKNDYGLVVIDMPPASEFDCPPAAGWLDEAVLVVEAERTRVQSAQRAKALLERAGVRVMGVVLANRREHVPGWLYDRL